MDYKLFIMSNNARNDNLVNIFMGTNYDRLKYEMNLFLELKELHAVINNDDSL